MMPGGLHVCSALRLSGALQTPSEHQAQCQVMVLKGDPLPQKNGLGEAQRTLAALEAVTGRCTVLPGTGSETAPWHAELFPTWAHQAASCPSLCLIQLPVEAESWLWERTSRTLCPLTLQDTVTGLYTHMCV